MTQPKKKLYKFKSDRGEVAVTSDKTGAKLPPRHKWQYIGEVNISADDGPRIGADSADIVGGVERDGYFILPAPKKQPAE